jgi:anti-sigma factor RsiW
MTDARDFDLVPDMLSGYLDDELTAPERAAVEARLSVSAEWRDELEEVRAARDAVRSLPARDAPEGFWTRVTTAVEADGDATADGARDADSETVTAPVPITVATGTKRGRGRGRVGKFVVAAGVAAAAMIVAVAVLPGRTTVKPNVAAVATQHGAATVGASEPISALTPVGPLAGFR